MNFRKFSLMSILVSAFIFSLPQSAEAAKKKGGKGAFAGGSLSLGFGVGIVTADQSGLNGMIRDAKAANGASTSDFNSGYEFSGQLTFRFSNNLVAIQLRPSYIMQSASGSASDGSYDYKLTGFTLFPLVRIIPLSNDIIDFYLQAGLGYGKLDGDITNGPRNAKFSGSSFGMQVGVGADFCLVPDHCFGVEGNYRYLPIVRNIVSSASASTVYGASQAATDRELENLNGSDIATSLTGISGALSYTYNF
ncbi:MAG: outer membrane beta-barrel protein [Bdellovibrio sp.]|nr:outer membrane beta-barrel protein [Bdellovibrio sp.]